MLCVHVIFFMSEVVALLIAAVSAIAPQIGYVDIYL